MRLEIIILLTLSTLSVACCGNKDFKSCCGKGKCNIFCCNCDGGCNTSCKPIKLPICWAWQGGTICDNPDGSTSWSGGGPKPRPNKPTVAHIGVENFAVSGEAMGEEPVVIENPVVEINNGTSPAIGGIKISRVTTEGILEDDHAMHQTVDGHGKGFFTFNEFLKYTGAERNEESEEYFAKYDVNGDGVITPDEMRLQD